MSIDNQHRQHLVNLRDKVSENSAVAGDFYAAFGGTAVGLGAAFAYNGDSMDAAFVFLKAAIPECVNTTLDESDEEFSVQVFARGMWHYGRSKTPARAWLLAVIEALIYMEDSE